MQRNPVLKYKSYPKSHYPQGNSLIENLIIYSWKIIEVKIFIYLANKIKKVIFFIAKRPLKYWGWILNHGRSIVYAWLPAVARKPEEEGIE